MAFGTEQLKLLSFLKSHSVGANSQRNELLKDIFGELWECGWRKIAESSFLVILMSFYLLFIGSDDLALLLICHHETNVFCNFPR